MKNNPAMKSADLKWFALKVFYNRINEVSDILRTLGIEIFVPIHNVTSVKADGRKVTSRVPLIPSLMFFRASPVDAASIDRQLADKAMTYKSMTNRYMPAPIRDDEMEIFRLVTNNFDSPLEYLGGETERYTVGERVKITGGPFEGAEGCICRIKGDKRLVVTISGVCAVATSYIPTCFIEKI